MCVCLNKHKKGRQLNVVRVCVCVWSLASASPCPRSLCVCVCVNVWCVFLCHVICFSIALV